MLNNTVTQKEKEQLKSLILKEITTIETELHKFADENPVVDGDYQTRFPKTADASDTADERAQDITEYERERAVEESLELRLKELRETLEKLESDDYGLCSNCRSPIEKPRLQAMPTVSSCFTCASKASLV